MAMIYLVRHAQASFGTSDYDRLSELGHQQARWLGEYFGERGLRFSRVMTGTLRRQRETAAGVLDVLGQQVDVQTHPGLDEYHAEPMFRAHTGMNPIEAQRADYAGYWRQFREAMLAWAADGLSGLPETWGEFGRRIDDAWTQSVRETRRDDNILLVSSGGAIGRGVAQMLGAPASVAIELNLQFRNSGFCELIAGGGTFRLLSFNVIPHLEREERRHAITFA
ncbi:MAG: histidine phosphatase family protein [Burkholderiaceae bacterium]